MKKIAGLLFTILIQFTITAQNPYSCVWTSGSNGLQNERSGVIVVDNSGSVLTGGYFDSPVACFGTDSLTGAGGIFESLPASDMWLAKRTAQGTVVWAKNWGASSQDEQLTAIATGTEMQIYAGGTYTGTFSLDSIPLINNSAKTDVFLARFNASGWAVWAVKGSEGNAAPAREYVGDVAPDPAGNLFAIGTYGGNNFVLCGDSVPRVPGICPTCGDIFIVKFDNAGNLMWLSKLGSDGDDNGACVTTDLSGRMYIGGYSNSAVLAIGSDTVRNRHVDFFVARYDFYGDPVWAVSGSGNNHDFIEDMEAGSDGNIYITGFFTSDTLYFGTELLVNSNNNASGDIYVAAIDSSGQVLWLRGAGGISMELSGGISLDKSDNIYVSGSYSSSAVGFGGADSLANAAGNMSYDVFIAGYDPNGNFLWAKKAGGDASDENTGIDNSPAGSDCYIAGNFNSPVAFFDTLYCSNTGSWDVFTAKFSPLQSSSLPVVDQKPEWKYYPNPSEGLINVEGEAGEAEFILQDMTGRTVVNEKLFLDAGSPVQFSIPDRVPQGFYLLFAVTPSGMHTMPVILHRR